MLLQLFKDYVASPTHKWWVDHVWRPSWTKFTSMFVGIPSTLIVAGQYVSTLAGDDKIASLLAQMHVPDGVFTTLAVVSLVYYIAHGRD